MSNLYSNLSAVYEAMYQSFINYDDEFDFYYDILRQYKVASLLEVGCGTGHLATRFTETAIAYKGMDISPEMLNIAQKNNPDIDFIRADMREFNLPDKVDACIITGRTISYLITNEDVQQAFYSISRNLTTGGILCFDFIDASVFVPRIKNGEEIVHSAKLQSKQYRRNSSWSINHSQSWTFNWTSTFFEQNDRDSFTEIGQDHSVIRAFTKDDLRIFLSLAGFEIVEILDKKTYAFDTGVVIAKKA